jgi:hypothetical protein
MAYTTINKGSSYFNTVLYTGTGATNARTGIGFQPDWTWIKCRNTTDWHILTDAVRGATKTIYSNSTAAETTQAQALQSFNTDGFTLGTSTEVNANANTYVAWNWLGANTTVSNTAGTISSTVSANTTSGFSIVSYTGTGANATVGHGLGVAPSMLIVKNRGTAGDWRCYHKSLGNTQLIRLNLTNATLTNASWNNTTPTSTVFSIGVNDDVNQNGGTHIAYCFAEVKGFSKFGSYTGNGSTDGTFVYTGFTPAFVMTKESSGTSHWIIHDTKRSPNNEMRKELYANLSNAEAENARYIDCLSNGFKIRSDDDTQINGSGATYIYMAFASSPFVSSKGIPTTAR